MSKLGQLRTCLSLMAAIHNLCLLLLKELSISITYLLQSLSAMLKFHSVMNLGFTLDCHLTMNAHVSNIARTCYFELRRLTSIRRVLTSTATATLVSAFIWSRIDNCNSLMFGSTHDVTSKLQRIQNYAARVILRLTMSSSITTHLKSLHWLPVKVGCTYKIACLCYHCHHHMSDIRQYKPSNTRYNRSNKHTCHFSIDLHTVRQHLVIARFLLLLLLS